MTRGAIRYPYGRLVGHTSCWLRRRPMTHTGPTMDAMDTKTLVNSSVANFYAKWQIGHHHYHREIPTISLVISCNQNISIQSFSMMYSIYHACRYFTMLTLKYNPTNGSTIFDHCNLIEILSIVVISTLNVALLWLIQIIIIWQCNFVMLSITQV